MQTAAVADDTGAGGTTLTLLLPTPCAADEQLIVIITQGTGNVTKVTDNIDTTTGASWTPRIPTIGAGLGVIAYDKLTGCLGVDRAIVNYSVSTISGACVLRRNDITGWQAHVYNNNAPGTSWTSTAVSTTGPAWVIGGTASADGSNQSHVSAGGFSPIVGTGLTSGHNGNTVDGDDYFYQDLVSPGGGSISSDGTCSVAASNISAAVFAYSMVAPDGTYQLTSDLYF